MRENPVFQHCTMKRSALRHMMLHSFLAPCSPVASST